MPRIPLFDRQNFAGVGGADFIHAIAVGEQH